MRYNQPPSYEGRGEALETLNSLQQGFQGLSAATFMKQFSSGTNTRAIECAAEYMHQSDMFVSRLAEAVNRGSVAVYRTLPQVDAHVGSSMNHELFLPHQEEHMPYRIFVEHTDFRSVKTFGITTSTSWSVMVLCGSVYQHTIM